MAYEESLALFRAQGHTLSDREYRAWVLRLGLDRDGEPRTIELVGAHLCTPERPDGLSRERTRQILAISAAHMRDANQ